MRFLETPHVHHWDSPIVLEETSNSLFPADLFAHPGDQPAMVQESEMRQYIVRLRVIPDSAC